MAKKSIIQREIKRKKLNFKYNQQKLKIKNLIKNCKDFEGHMTIQKELQKIPRNSAICRLRNRCWATGRGRGFYRDFGLSRHVLREMAHDCLLPGIRKSSW